MLFKFNVMKNIKQNSVVISYAVVLDSTSVEVSVKHWNSLRLYVELMLGCFPEVISQRIFPSRKFPRRSVSQKTVSHNNNKHIFQTLRCFHHCFYIFIYLNL